MKNSLSGSQANLMDLDCHVTEPSEKMASFWALIHQGCIKHFQNKVFLEDCMF